MTTEVQCPTHGKASIELIIYPRTAQALLNVLEAGLACGTAGGEPAYVQHEIDNFRNHLRAHLQRVSIGE